MTKKEQRIAIAEACGIKTEKELGILYHAAKDRKEFKSFGNSEEYTRQKCQNYQSQGISCELVERVNVDMLPDYLNDLNAMHEAFITLSRGDKRKFIGHLCDILLPTVKTLISLEDYLSATAGQRAEAFLRTLNLWRQDNDAS